MSDPGTKHTACDSTFYRGRKAEVEVASYTDHTLTSEDDSEMAYLLDKCHHVKKYRFQLHISSHSCS